MEMDLESANDEFADEMERLFKLDTLRLVVEKKSDTLLIAPTGSGKSVIFQLIGLYGERKGCVFIITPTLELQKSQLLELCPLLAKNFPEVSAVAMGSSSTIDAEALRGEHKFVLVTPERAYAESDALLKLDADGLLLAVVYDECHVAADSGWCVFIGDVSVCVRPFSGNVAATCLPYPGDNTLESSVTNSLCLIVWQAMTATCPADDVASIIDRTGLRNPVILRSSSARPNFTYSVRSQTNAESDLAFVVDHVRAGKDAIIFVPTRKATAQIYSIFQKALPELCTACKPCILPIHSSLSPAHRTNVLTSWKAGDIKLLIATSVLSNGVHKDGVSVVVHWGMASSMTEYMQQARLFVVTSHMPAQSGTRLLSIMCCSWLVFVCQCGRGGRGAAATPCDAVAFVSPGSLVHTVRAQSTMATKAKIQSDQVQQSRNGFHVGAYCTTRMCRAKWLAKFMGDPPGDAVATGQCCDNCIYAASDREGLTRVQMGYEISALLQSALETAERFTFSVVVAITKGPARMPKAAQHIQSTDDCSTFGSMHKSSGQARTSRELISLCHGAVSLDPPLFAQSGSKVEKVGGMALTQAGRALLRANPFTPTRAAFQGSFLFLKPAVMLSVPKQPGQPKLAADIVLRSQNLALAMRGCISALATTHQLSAAHVLPAHCFDLLATKPIDAVQTSDALRAVPDLVGALFDALPDLWPPFCTELIRVLSLAPDELAPVPVSVSSSAQPVAHTKTNKTNKRQRTSKQKAGGADKENLKPTAGARRKKRLKNADLDFVPEKERTSQEAQSAAHARSVLAFSKPGSKPTAGSIPLASRRAALQPVAPQQRPTRASAVVSTFLMAVRGAKRKVFPPGELNADDPPAKAMRLSLPQAPPAVASRVLDEILRDCKGDAKQFHELVWGTRAAKASVGPNEDEKLRRRLQPLHKHAVECGSKGDCLYRSFIHQLKERLPSMLPKECKKEMPSSGLAKKICLSWLGNRPRADVVEFFLPGLLAVYPPVVQRPQLSDLLSTDASWRILWKAYLSTLYGAVANFGDELILVALAESFKIRILVYSSRGAPTDRIFTPSAAPCGEVQLGHMVEAHYQSVVENRLNE